MSELHEIFKDFDVANYVTVGETVNKIEFVLQQGPVKEFGANGCDVIELVWAARNIIRAFNKRVPCRENSLAITKLEEAMHWLTHRTGDRESRGVEGTDKE